MLAEDIDCEVEPTQGSQIYIKKNFVLNQSNGDIPIRIGQKALAAHWCFGRNKNKNCKPKWFNVEIIDYKSPLVKVKTVIDNMDELPNNFTKEWWVFEEDDKMFRLL